MTRAIVSPEGQSATFVELFFDLVFVFGVTQLVYLFHHDVSWAGAGKTVLVFWMVWWAWTQFTWALNAADTTHPLIEAGTLLATAVAFFMAIAVPTALVDGKGLWFAIPYVGVRVLGLLLYAVAAAPHAELRHAVASFASLSVGGLVTALLGGWLGGQTLLYLWGATIFLDIVAAAVAGNHEEWSLHPEHFAERHGLIVIIALGESLIVAAGGLVSTDAFSWEVLGVGALAVLISCALWWTYFPIVKPALEEAMVRADAQSRSRIGRDAFSLAHFPMLCGVIAYAVGLEEALAHPSDVLPTAGRLAIALGIALFVGGSAIAVWRASCGNPSLRVVISLLTAGTLYFATTLPAIGTLAIAFTGVLLIAVIDERRADRLREAAHG